MHHGQILELHREVNYLAVFWWKYQIRRRSSEQSHYNFKNSVNQFGMLHSRPVMTTFKGRTLCRFGFSVFWYLLFSYRTIQRCPTAPFRCSAGYGYWCSCPVKFYLRKIEREEVDVMAATHQAVSAVSPFAWRRFATACWIVLNNHSTS